MNQLLPKSYFHLLQDVMNLHPKWEFVWPNCASLKALKVGVFIVFWLWGLQACLPPLTFCPCVSLYINSFAAAKPQLSMALAAGQWVMVFSLEKSLYELIVLHISWLVLATVRHVVSPPRDLIFKWASAKEQMKDNLYSTFIIFHSLFSPSIKTTIFSHLWGYVSIFSLLSEESYFCLLVNWLLS